MSYKTIATEGTDPEYPAYWPGVVYLVYSNKTRSVKIGHSRDMESRYRALCQGMGEKLELIGTIAGDEEVERALHDQFRAHALGHEWFKPKLEIFMVFDEFADLRLEAEP